MTSVAEYDIITMFENRWCGSMAEQLICNQQVVGSTPITSSSYIRRPCRRILRILYGSVPEWPKGTDCKSAGNAFGGPNPPAPTNKNRYRIRDTYFCLSKPQAWYIIAAQRAVYIIKGGEPPLYLITRQRAICLRLDDIQHFVLVIYNATH